MSSYWLSRKGGPAEGPFSVSQIVIMWSLGKFTAVDQLCEDGAHDWQPASYVMQYVDAGMTSGVAVQEQEVLEEVPPVELPAHPLAARAKRALLRDPWEPTAPKPFRTDWVTVGIGIVAIAILGSILYFSLKHAHEGVYHPAGVQVVIQSWVDRSFADKHAEVVSIGKDLAWSTGGVLNIVEIRAKNVFGSSVTSYMVMELNRNKSAVVNAWQCKEWINLFMRSSDARQYPGTVREISGASYR